MDKDELIERFKAWAEDNGYEDAVATAPRDGGEWGVEIDTVSELSYDFVESLDDEALDELGGMEKAQEKTAALADELGPYWKPGW